MPQTHMPEPERRRQERPTFPREKRRHEEDMAQQERAMEELHEDRGERKAADRHARRVDAHEERAAELRAVESELEAQYQTLATPSKGALTTFRVLLPIGLVAAAAVAIGGLYGLASPGLIPVGVAVMALGIGVVVNGAILFGLLVSLRATDQRVRQLAAMQAARYAQNVRQDQQRRADRHEQSDGRTSQPKTKMVEYHRVRVRPRQAETKYQAVQPTHSTSRDDGYQTKIR